MKCKFTMHGKVRIKERMYFPNKNYDEIIKRVKKYGKAYNRYEGKLFQFLTTKQLRYQCRIVIYDEMVFAFSKSDNKLITVYKVPEKYLPTSSYEINKKIYSKISNLRNLNRCAVQVVLNDNTKYEGYVNAYKNTTPWVDIKLELFDGSAVKIFGKDIKDFKPIAVKFNKKNKNMELVEEITI